MKSYCENCQTPTNQEVLKEIISTSHDEESNWWEENKYQIIKCRGCDTITFRMLYDDTALQQYEEGDASRQELFPKRHIHSRIAKKYHSVSGKLIKVYNETIEAFNSNLRLLSSIGVRAILEGICMDKQVTEGTYTNLKGKVVTSKDLMGKIHGLAEKGYLTTTQAEFLHELRFLGNAAVHELAIPEIHELRMAIDIIEHVLENLYEIHQKARRLRLKRMNTE